MNKRTIMAALMLLPLMVNAESGDYIWNEQFSKKIVEAEAGKPRAQYDIGNMYQKGQGTAINEPKAFSWFNKAAKSNHVKAQFKVGYMLLNGLGTKRNSAKAEKWLRKAANKKYAPAQYYLGMMYRDGKHLTRNYDKSLFWLKKARENGFWKAAKEYDKVIALAKRGSSRRVRKPAAVKPRVAPQRRTKKSAVVSEDFRDVLLVGNWFERGKPARHFPSEVTQCEKKRRGLACASKQDLIGKRGNTTFTYRIVATLKNINEAGEFTVVYNNNVLSVVPGAPITIPSDDDEDPPTTIPSPVVELGFQRTVHNLDCQLDNAKQISCIKDYSRAIKINRR